MAPWVTIFGCGNILLGDDGFGPAVIDALSTQSWVGPDVQLVDAGTGVREYLLDYILSPAHRPSHIIILDAVDHDGQSPGELFEMDPSSIPTKKIHDFSLHQFPTVNLLQELKNDTGIDVVILAAQVGYIPDHIAPGLSADMRAAIPAAVKKIRYMLELKSAAEGIK